MQMWPTYFIIILFAVGVSHLRACESTKSLGVDGEEKRVYKLCSKGNLLV